MTAQMNRVLVSPELLGSIFTHVDPRDLLVNIQRVSKTWHFAVKNSLTIQRRLFLAPMPASPGDLVREINPFVQGAFAAWFKVVGLLITDRTHYSSDYSFVFNGRYGEQRTADMCAEASWRRMLPVQPPPTMLEVIKVHPSGVLRSVHQPIGEVALLECKEGIRMGSLYDLGWETVHHPYAKFACVWKMFPTDHSAEKGDIFARQGRLQEQQKNGGGIGSRFKLEDKVTLLMDLSMPLVGMGNAMKPEYKSKAYEPVEQTLEFKDVNQASELAHLVMMCSENCTMH